MSNANTNKDTLNGIEENVDLDSFTKEGFKSLTGGIRHSNALPVDTDWNFYKLNKSFNKITGNEGERLSKLINSILRKYDIDDNVNSRKSIKDKIELIVEANDSILEKISDNIDEINGIKKKNLQPVQFQTVTAELPTISGSWNRINRATFSVTSLGNLPKVNPNSTKSIHLLTGKNIIRPQTFFKDKIDNSNLYPWQPRITEKPNSIRPLAIFLEPTEFGEEFCHPYQTELDQFEPPSHQLQHVTPTKPKPVSETPLHMIETSERLDELVKELLKYPIIAVDLEHHSYRTFLGITCLMQISTIEADYIIDTLVLRDKLYLLNEVFTKPSIIKVFHGADSDILWLQRDLSIYVVNMFDTHQAAKQLGYSGLSLSYLLQQFCKFIPNKQFQLADWRIRPLPEELISYAREDTHFLIYLYEVLKMELLKKGNGKDNLLKAVIQKSTELCKRRYLKPILNNDSHLDFYRKCKRLFDNKQMFALKELYQWRDKTARDEDESTGYVLPNHMLLQIAEVLPREMQGILACCNPIPPLVRSNLLELHKIILRAREQSVEKPIMKEDNRSMGSTQQFSKINIESSLHCPHDLTKQSEFRDDLPTLLSEKGITVSDWRKKCGKLNEGLEQTASKYTAFNTPENPDEDETNCPIKFLSPYERYKLVKPFIQAQEEKETTDKVKEKGESDDISTDDRIALLHEHFLKVAKECPQPNTELGEEVPQISFSQEMPAMIPFIMPKNDSPINQSNQKKRKFDTIQPLSKMQGVKRKKTNFTPPSIDSNFNASSGNPLHTPVPNMDSPSFDKKRKRPNKKKRNPNQGQNQQQSQQPQPRCNTNGNDNSQIERRNVATRGKKRNRSRNRKAKMESNNDVNTNPSKSVNNSKFKSSNYAPAPFDYSSVDYSEFQGGAAGSSGGNPRKYQSKFRGKNKRFGGRSNNKFATFEKKMKI